MKTSRFVAIAAGLAGICLAGASLAQNLATRPGYPGQVTDTRTGKVWVPSRDPKNFPVCPMCQELYAMSPEERMKWYADHSSGE